KPLSVKKMNFCLKNDRFQFWSFTQAYQQSINEDIANQRPVFMQYSIVPGSFEQFEDAFDINEIEKSFPNPISGVYLLFKEESMIDAPIGIIIIDSFLDKSGCVSEFIGFLPNHRKHGYGGLALNWL